MVGIPPDIMYTIDGALEMGHITTDVHVYLTLFEQNPVAWHDSLSDFGDQFFAGLSASSRQRLAAWRAQAPSRERAAVTWAGINSLPDLVRDSARHAASAAVKLCGPDHIAVETLLSDPEFLFKNADPLASSISELAMRARDDVRIMGRQAFVNTREMVPEIMRMANENRMRLIGLAMAEYETRRAASILPRTARKARRKPLIKAMSLLSAVAGRTTAIAFLHGDDIIVEGRLFDFKVRKGVLTSNGHGAMNITVTDKHHVELVDLCFYFVDMPAPDQLAALIMHVKAGNEDDILTTANVIRTHPGGRSSTDLKRIRDRKKELEDSRRQAQTSTIADTAAIGEPTVIGLDHARDAMSAHVDMVLFNGRRGSGAFYRDLMERRGDELELEVLRAVSSRNPARFLSDLSSNTLDFEIAGQVSLSP